MPSCLHISPVARGRCCVALLPAIPMRTLIQRKMIAQWGGAWAFTAASWVLCLIIAQLRAQDFSYSTYNGTITITGYTGTNGEVVLPGTINGLPVTTIESNAFMWQQFITNIVIADSVTTIGDYAFWGCENLGKATIGRSVTSIGNYAFSGPHCSGPPTTNVCIFGCPLDDITIPERVVKLGDYAFQGCSRLTNVMIGDSLAIIGAWAFSGCYNLTNLTIPDSLVEIRGYAFVDSGLKAIHFKGNAPQADATVFGNYSNPIVYYLPGTTGWTTNFGGSLTAVWILPYPWILKNTLAFGVQSKTFGFTVSWATNLPVVIEACTDLSKPNWLTVATNPLDVGVFYFSDPSGSSYPRRFFRVRSP